MYIIRARVYLNARLDIDFVIAGLCRRFFPRVFSSRSQFCKDVDRRVRESFKEFQFASQLSCTNIFSRCQSRVLFAEILKSCRKIRSAWNLIRHINCSRIISSYSSLVDRFLWLVFSVYKIKNADIPLSYLSLF